MEQDKEIEIGRKNIAEQARLGQGARGKGAFERGHQIERELERSAISDSVGSVCYKILLHCWSQDQ